MGAGPAPAGMLDAEDQGSPSCPGAGQALGGATVHCSKFLPVLVALLVRFSASVCFPFPIYFLFCFACVCVFLSFFSFDPPIAQSKCCRRWALGGKRGALEKGSVQQTVVTTRVRSAPAPAPRGPPCSPARVRACLRPSVRALLLSARSLPGEHLEEGSGGQQPVSRPTPAPWGTGSDA